MIRIARWTSGIDSIGELPLFKSHIIQRDVVGDASVIDQNIQRAEFLLQNREAMIHVCLVSHIGLHGDAFAGRILGHNFMGDFFCGLYLQIHHDDAGGTFLSEFPAVAGAHASTGAGHHGDLALYHFFHVNTLSFRNKINRKRDAAGT